MNPEHIAIVSKELSLRPDQISQTAQLLAEGSTVPFISRYRKEATGSLDEVAVTAIRDRLAQLAAIDDRRQTILSSLEKNGHLTDELQEKVMEAKTMTELEDIYLPYRPKRRTKATIAKEKGLEPLADFVFAQNDADPEKEAAGFVDPEKGVESVDDALAGARDIIAEKVNEDKDAREALRKFFKSTARFVSTVVPGLEETGAKFKDYFEWEEPVSLAPSHRVLAMRRGEKEGFLDLAVEVDDQEAVKMLEKQFVTGVGLCSQQVRLAVSDGYKRLLFRSMETEIRMDSKKIADEEAVKVFVENMRHLLLASPLGQKRVLAVDPGLRTGCKVTALDAQGNLLHYEAIFPHSSDHKRHEAGMQMTRLLEKYQPEAIAIGNGTASRETEAFVRSIPAAKDVAILVVDESGASVYSASKVAREEFPDHDVTVRGAVSIGRRLMDPLAELVKIDPKSIGVGQYQHDVDQGLLKNSLDDVVVSCVNAVGVEVNTASAQLLNYVSGLGPKLAVSIVAHRAQNGPFRSRTELKNVPRLGPKAFVHAAGFLRINNGEHPLDASAVHPESYHIVDAMAKDLGCEVKDLMEDADLRKKIKLSDYVTDSVGLPTLNDILDELAKPGRDPREKLEAFSFAADILTMEDLEPGMKLPGIVTNVTNFGAFVDIGVHQDGLVHISQLADKFVKDPNDVVRVQQKVTVRVLDVDIARKRISLSMKAKPDTNDSAAKPARRQNSGRPANKGAKPQAKTDNTPFNNPFAALAGKRFDK